MTLFFSVTVEFAERAASFHAVANESRTGTLLASSMTIHSFHAGRLINLVESPPDDGIHFACDLLVSKTRHRTSKNLFSILFCFDGPFQCGLLFLLGDIRTS